jgi:hypothetical protein
MFAFKTVAFTSSAIGNLACCFSVYAYPKPESTPSPTSPAFPLPTLSSADDALRTYPSILLRRLRHPLCVRVLPRTWSVSSPLHERPAALVHVTAPPVWWSSLPIPPSLFPRCIRQSCPRSRSCAKSFPSCPCHSRFRTLAFRFTRRHSSKSCHRLPPCLFNWKYPPR